MKSVLPLALLAALPLLLAVSPAGAQDDGEDRVVVLKERVVGADRRPVLGFTLSPGPPPVVGRILPGSPVARAGLRTGDVILGIDGEPATAESIVEASRGAAPGDTIRMRVRRDGAERDLVVVAGGPLDWDDARVIVIDADSIRAMTRRILEDARRFDDDQFDFDFDLDPEGFRFDVDSLRGAIRLRLDSLRVDPRLHGIRFGRAAVPGARLADLVPGLARHFAGADAGALVLEVRAGSPAAEAGLEPGDVIVAVDGRPVRDVDGVRDAADGDRLDLEVVRDGGRRTLTIDRR